MQIYYDEYNLPDEKAMKKKRKLKRMKTGLKLFLTLMLIVAASVLLAISPLFNITDIEVSGSKHYENETIIDIAGITVGSNGFKMLSADLSGILSLRYSWAEKNIIRSCPYVKSAVVKFVPPAKVAIGIVERDAFCIIPYLGTSLVVDDEGYVIDTAAEAEAMGLPVIKGIKIKKYELGSRIEIDEPDSLNSVVTLIKTVEESDRNSRNKISGLIDSVDVADPANILVFLDSRIVVNIGGLQDLRYRVEVMKHIFFNNIKKGEKGLLDFTESENPVLKREG